MCPANDDELGRQTGTGAEQRDPTDSELPTLMAGSDANDQTVVHGLSEPAFDAPSVAGGTSADTLLSTQPPSEGSPNGQANAQLLAGRFEVMGELGEGGMGKVYAVRDRQIEGREVALKLLHPRFSENKQFRDLFFQEIRAAQSFVSENVVQVRDTGQMGDGRLFLTMDLVAGESLTELLAREEVLVARHALEIARQTLLGLHSGHEQGFVHRDIKPSNVMLSARVPKTDDNPFGVQAKVLDFGLASVAADIDENRIAGTPMYMSPEQAQGHRLDPRSDLFAVGVVLYEMLAGRRPFEGTTLQEVTASVIETNVAPLIGELEHLSKPVQKILKKALQKDRNKRFQSAAEFVKAIEGSKAYTAPTGMPAWAIGGLCFFALGGGLAGAFGMKQWRQNNQMKLDALSAGLDTATKINAATAERDDHWSTQLEDLQARYNELQDTRTGDVADTGNVERDKLALKQQINDLEQDLGSTQADLQTALADRAEFKAKFEAAQEKVNQHNLRTKPEAVMAGGFDRIVTFVERGNGEAALGEFQGLVNAQVFDMANRDGRELVMAIAQVADSLDRYASKIEAGEGADLALLSEAKGHLADAQEQLGSFEIGAADWLEFDLGEELEKPRSDRAREIVEFLADRVDASTAALATLDGDDWAQISAQHGENPESDPTRAFAHARQHSCDHFAGLASEFAQHLDATVASGGAFDADALEGVESLEAWGDFLSQDPGSNPESGERILLYWYAKHWFESGELADEPLAVPALSDGTPHADWRAQLALQQSLARTDSAFPLPEGSEAIFQYKSLEGAGGVSWWIETPTSENSDGTAWEFERKIHYPDPSRRPPPINIEITRRGNAFFQRGVEVLSLIRTDSTVSVARWMPSEDPAFLGKHWSPTHDEFEAFRDDLAQHPAECLVVKQGTFVRWFSPRYGLVREENEGVSVRELKFARFAR